MAMAARSERVAPRREAVRIRVHGSGTGGERVMTKRTAPVAHISARPNLTLVPRRRRTARLIAAVCAPMFALMLGAAAFQTQLASRQLRLDTIDREIRVAYDDYDLMRRERAELRSPGRLATEAAALGMVPAEQTQFLALDPDVIATVQRSGAADDQAAPTDLGEEFDQYADVKAQSSGAP